MMKRTTLLTLTVLLLGVGLQTAALAQIEQILVRVDGLSCPFCACGLEKKLKKVPGIAQIEINIDKGTATLQPHVDTTIGLNDLRPAVTAAGFTPRDIVLSVTGSVQKTAGAFLLTVPNTELQFTLKTDTEPDDLQRLKAGESRKVKIIGGIEQPDEATAATTPFILKVEQLEVIE